MKLRSADEILFCIYQDNMDIVNYLYNIIENHSDEVGIKYLIQQYEKNKYKSDICVSYAIGYMYSSELSKVKMDYDKAIYWYKVAFNKNGNINAGLDLAIVYYNSKKYQKAFDIYTKLATINHHQALTAIGLFYRNGWYVEKNFEKALEYFFQGEKYGNLEAMIGRASIYRKQHKYLKSFFVILKAIPLRILSALKGELEERTRVI